MKQPIKRKIAAANGITNEKQIYTLIVDGNNLLKRSLTDKRMNNSGEQYGGVVRFINRLGIILSKKDFDYCIVSWDGPGSGILRWRMHEDYKANRDKHYDILNAETDYDKYCRDFRRKVIETRKKMPTVRGETDEEAFQRQKNIIQDILEELCIRQYEFEDVEGDADSLAGLLLEIKGDFPELHERLDYKNFTFEVTELDGHRISKVKVIIHQ